MATVNLSKKQRRNYKRGICVFSTVLTQAEIAVSGDINQLMQLPPESVVTRASVVIITPSNAATSAAVDVGFAGGNQLIAAGNLKAVAGTDVSSDITAVVRETGGTVTLKPTYVGAQTAGKYLVLIEYIEYEKVTGEITNFVPEA